MIVLRLSLMLLKRLVAQVWWNKLFQRFENDSSFTNSYLTQSPYEFLDILGVLLFQGCFEMSCKFMVFNLW